MPVTQELIGDSARGDSYAFVRLVVDGERILEADAPGLSRPLVGLTLLEAAAVPGEALAADALANALGPAFQAGSHHDRVAVAMSGGVDSAVALLRAGPPRDRRHAASVARPSRATGRPRMLLACGGDQAENLPRPRSPARHARPEGLLPSDSRAIVRRRVRGRRDAKSLYALQRHVPRLRGARRVRPTRRSRCSMDGALRSDCRAGREAPRFAGRRPWQRPVLHAGNSRPRAAFPCRLPLGAQS